MKVEEKKLTFAELVALKAADLFSQAKIAVKVGKAVESAKDKFTEALQFSAKVVAAMKRHYTSQINERQIPADTSFKKYFEQNAGGVCPPRIEALAALFNALCLTFGKDGKPLLAEEIFDEAAVDWLEKANAIVKAAQKQFGDAWKTCDDVLDTVNALSKPGNAAKKLNEIRKRQKGEQSEENVAPALTVGIAIQFLMAAIHSAADMAEENAASLYADTFKLGNAWAESGISDETLNKWATNIDRGVAPHIAVTSETQAVAA